MNICKNMSPETIALTLFAVVIFSMVISQLESEVSMIPEQGVSQKTIIIHKGFPAAVTAAESSPDTVWFIQITNDIDMGNDLIRDSYGNFVLTGQHYLKRHFLEKANMVKNGHIYKVNKKHFTIFFEEPILYPFIRFYDIPKGLLLKNEDVVDFLMYAQSTDITTAL